jgi:hypothetical protein
MNDRSLTGAHLKTNECGQGNKKRKRNHVCKKNDEQLDERESLKRMQPPEGAEAKYQ